jgi:hypothetical protein
LLNCNCCRSTAAAAAVGKAGAPVAGEGGKTETALLVYSTTRNSYFFAWAELGGDTLCTVPPLHYFPTPQFPKYFKKACTHSLVAVPGHVRASWGRNRVLPFRLTTSLVQWSGRGNGTGGHGYGSQGARVEVGTGSARAGGRLIGLIRSMHTLVFFQYANKSHPYRHLDPLLFGLGLLLKTFLLLLKHETIG